MTAELALPAPLDSAEPGAWTEYGRRIICWTIRQEGEWHRNRFTYAWVDVTEREPWKGEPLWVSATRRTSESAIRESFTDRAREAISREVLPVIARYGFSRLWTELHRIRNANTPDGARGRAEQAIADARWWTTKAELTELHIDGRVEFVPIVNEIGKRPVTVSVVPAYAAASTQEAAACRAFVDGEHVGWLTVGGDLVPVAATVVP